MNDRFGFGPDRRKETVQGIKFFETENAAMVAQPRRDMKRSRSTDPPPLRTYDFSGGLTSSFAGSVLGGVVPGSLSRRKPLKG